jgi:hypothetical protein
MATGKMQNAKRKVWNLEFGIEPLRGGLLHRKDLFRISNFGFRI